MHTKFQWRLMRKRCQQGTLAAPPKHLRVLQPPLRTVHLILLDA
jgi:hypothetical protein